MGAPMIGIFLFLFFLREMRGPFGDWQRFVVVRHGLNELEIF